MVPRLVMFSSTRTLGLVAAIAWMTVRLSSVDASLITMTSAGAGDCDSSARSAAPTNFSWLKFGKITEMRGMSLIGMGAIESAPADGNKDRGWILDPPAAALRRCRRAREDCGSSRCVGGRAPVELAAWTTCRQPDSG